jgi:hypothetical protein
MAISRIHISKGSRLRSFYYGDEDYKLIGSANKLACYVSVQDDVMMEAVFVSPKNERCGYTVCEVQLSRVNDENPVWSADTTHVDTRFQGYGIVPRLYRYLIIKLNITLQAGSMQSPGGRMIWARLSDLNNITVYSKTKNGKPHHVETNDEGTELISDGHYQIYDGASNIQLFASAA